MHYLERGAGVPLVLLHAFPLDSRMWEAQVQELSGEFRVIAPDFAGFGQSASEQPFTIDSMAEDVYELLQMLNALPCALAGISMGGYVALAFASEHAADLRALILVDTKAEADTAQQREARQKMIDLARSQGSKAVADQMVPKLLAEETPKTRPAVAQAVRRMAESCPAKTIEHALAALRDRPDRTALLPTIKVPTLVLVGEGDVITPVTVAESMHRAIPGSQLTIIRGAGHLPPVEQPAQTSGAISRFLR
jgi:pimeloyl-ACP methyl ester carboxylesterase